MRKLALQMQMTIDGFIAGDNGELDFMVWDWDEKLKQYVSDLTETVDCIILGRKLAEGFIPHWAGVAANPDDPEFESGKQFTNLHKVVFSKTLAKSEWEKTVLARDDLIEEITRLKNQEGKNIIVYGGATFVSALIKNRLVDDLHLFINPAVIGNGLTIFKDIDQMQSFRLVRSTSFDCGIVVLNYALPQE